MDTLFYRRAGPALIYEDNMSTISLVKNGKSNSDKTRHISIRFFFISDRINIEIKVLVKII